MDCLKISVEYIHVITQVQRKAFARIIHSRTCTPHFRFKVRISLLVLPISLETLPLEIA
jgi:hypothetical protein